MCLDNFFFPISHICTSVTDGFEIENELKPYNEIEALLPHSQKDNSLKRATVE